MAGYRVLAIAAATGKMGFALIENEQLVEFGISQITARDPEKASCITCSWIASMKPEVVVSEEIGRRCRKRGNTIGILRTINKVADDLPVLNVTISKAQAYKNKYEEAEALAKQFAMLRSKLVEKPAIWESEPRRMIIFEAVSMANQVITSDSKV